MKQLILDGIQQMERQGCEAVILACTELPLFVEQSDTDMPLFSCTEILAQSVVQECFRTSIYKSVSLKGTVKVS